MGGQVELESEIDKGTTISFYILEKEVHNEGKFTIIIFIAESQHLHKTVCPSSRQMSGINNTLAASNCMLKSSKLLVRSIHGKSFNQKPDSNCISARVKKLSNIRKKSNEELR
jgi:hypothetical protein